MPDQLRRTEDRLGFCLRRQTSVGVHSHAAPAQDRGRRRHLSRRQKIPADRQAPRDLRSGGRPAGTVGAFLLVKEEIGACAEDHGAESKQNS